MKRFILVSIILYLITRKKIDIWYFWLSSVLFLCILFFDNCLYVIYTWTWGHYCPRSAPSSASRKDKDLLLWETPLGKGKKYYYLLSQEAYLLLVEANIYFRERHNYASRKEKKRDMFFASVWSTNVLLVEAQSCSLSEKKRKLERTMLPAHCFILQFFSWKKVCQNLLTWGSSFEDLDTRNPTLKMVRIWTLGLTNKMFWINKSTKNMKTRRLWQMAHMLCATCQPMRKQGWSWQGVSLNYRSPTTHIVYCELCSCVSGPILFAELTVRKKFGQPN